MWDLIGHETTIASLDRMSRCGSFPHALLITGPAGVGKQRLATEVAKALNCTEADPPGQRCIHCRQIHAATHPDVAIVEPAEGKASIAIEQIRTVRDSASLRPYQGSMKVYIIAAAETLTAQAADALLKSLEDPHPQVTFVLTAAEPDAVPATVRSRCRVVALRAVPAETIAGALQTRGMLEEDAVRIARLARGSVGWALRAAAQPKLAMQQEELLDRLCGTLDLRLDDRLRLAEELSADRKDRATVRRNLDMMVLLARDALRISAGLPATVASNSQERTLRSQAERIGLEQLLKYVECLRVATRRIDQNVDPRLTMEALLVSAP